MDLTLPVAQIIPATEAEGPGRRFAIWLQGCPLRCPGCCNPEMLPFAGGTEQSVDLLMAQILTVRKSDESMEGITLLGGEPFAHSVGAAELAARVASTGLTVMVFSGYALEELQARGDEQVNRLLANTDILVDGPYLRDQPETRRRWIGSANQRVHFLSNRCQADDPRWLLPNTLELRLVGGELIVNGFPAASAKDFWKRLPQEQNREASRDR
jgi:anaerobic ribonucleoside-triphosphate reductase activating protein